MFICLYLTLFFIVFHVESLKLTRKVAKDRGFSIHVITFLKTHHCKHSKYRIFNDNGFARRLVAESPPQFNPPSKKIRRDTGPRTIFPESPYCFIDQFTTQEDVWHGSIPTLGDDYSRVYTQHGIERVISESDIDPISYFDVPLPGVLRNRDAALRARTLLPPSKLKSFYYAPKKIKERLLDPTFQGYYSVLNNRNFHQFHPEFYYQLVDGDIKKNVWEYPSVDEPPDRPELERDKIEPSAPLGWRTFCILGLFPQGTKFDRCYSRTYKDLPQGRLSSGLFRYEGSRFIHTREAVDGDGHLIHSKLPIEADETFDGSPGELDIEFNSTPSEFSKYSPDRFSPYEPPWPRKSMETLITALSPSHIAWARLSTTLLGSTAKVKQLFRLERITEEKSKSKVISVGVLYTLYAPTFHHAIQLASSDPFARSRLYKGLHIYEVKDETNQHPLLGKSSTHSQYLVLATNEIKEESFKSLQASTLRFLVRSNCVNANYALYKPFLDDSADLDREHLQLLPLTDEQKTALIKSGVIPSIPDYSKVHPHANMYIINEKTTHEACEWANRLPVCRAGALESLFVTNITEVGFYPENCVLAAPVPTPFSLMPKSPEYVRISVDPTKQLLERFMKIGTAINMKVSGVVNDSVEFKADIKEENFVLLSGPPPTRFRVDNVSQKPSGKPKNTLLDQYAPHQLDRPFYSEFLSKFYYVQVPKGRYFFQEKPFSGANQAGTSAYNMTSLSASDMCHTPDYRPEAIAGLWLEKSKLGMLHLNKSQGVLNWTDKKGDRKKMLILSAIIEDMIKRGMHLECDSFYPPFLRKPRALATNLSKLDLLYGVYAFWNRGIEHYSVNREDELPPVLSCFAYDDRSAHMLQQNPDSAYDIQLDFLHKYERGLVDIEDEPLRMLSTYKNLKFHKVERPLASCRLWGKEEVTELWPEDETPWYSGYA